MLSALSLSVIKGSANENGAQAVKPSAAIQRHIDAGRSWCGSEYRTYDNDDCRTVRPF